MVDPTVFVVDDDNSVRNSLRRLIGSIGLPVKTYKSAAEFLEDFDPDAPGCIVLDVRMPEMSGLELQKRLAAANCPIPIIIVTAYADVPMAVSAMRAGAVGVIEKPYSPQELLDSVHLALNRDREAKRRHQEQREIRKPPMR